MDNLVSRLKTSLRIDGIEEDPLLYGYAMAAQLFVKNAIATDDEAFFASESVKPLFEMAVLSLAGAYYTYRIALVDTQSYPVDLTLNSIIAQLRGLYASKNYGGDVSGKEATV